MGILLDIWVYIAIFVSKSLGGGTFWASFVRLCNRHYAIDGKLIDRYYWRVVPSLLVPLLPKLSNRSFSLHQFSFDPEFEKSLGLGNVTVRIDTSYFLLLRRTGEPCYF